VSPPSLKGGEARPFYKPDTLHGTLFSHLWSRGDPPYYMVDAPHHQQGDGEGEGGEDTHTDVVDAGVDGHGEGVGVAPVVSPCG